MISHRVRLNTVIVGLGVAAGLPAQVPTPPIEATPTPTGTRSTPRANGPVVDLRNPSPPPTAEARGLIQFSRLLNANIQAADGSFGRVTDVVFDRNGNVQYLLASNHGQTFVLPYLPSAFSPTGQGLSFNVPVAALQQLAIDPQSLPPMQSVEFLTRMRQVFGPAFGTGQFISADPSTPNQAGIAGTARDPGVAATPRPAGIGATPSPGSASATATIGRAISAPTPGTTAGAVTVGVAAGTAPTGVTPNPLRAGTTASIPRTTLGDSWNWPNNGAANGRFMTPGATPGRNLGTGLPPIRQTPNASGGGLGAAGS